MLVKEFSQLPDKLLQLSAQELHEALGGPSLFFLPGRIASALFVSVLMHGNETTGWDALREVLTHYSCAGGERELPRSMYIFIANTSAAAQGLRHLPDQPDYNRVWPGTDLPACAESAMMQSLVDKLQALDLFASIDIHNNTGLNPHYACVNHLDNQSLHLAAMFCRTVVYFTTPHGLQSQAMAALCPAVTLECGLVGESRGIEHAAEFVEACLHLSEHPTQEIAARDIDLFHTTGIVNTLAGLEFAYDANARDLQLYPDIEYYNFRELPLGTAFGRVKREALPFLVKNEAGEDVSAAYFTLHDGEVITKKPLMPSMLTRDIAIIEQDCFCYLMERYPLEVQA
ncbi:MAG: succinylglutamate desuccinylase/aspartoacylase family protein [Gammaproteobacteria bacterium]|nr:succinylglutamate desuccinylase/aspartoacylase family protein [Gammaproteobacteria bacterium]NND40271.1 peptidase M14 [Pseudomonadales bacterium]NNL11742.1 peptidase M14 [Pseudomonadales bacterium]NNM12533.1 peptidase M14 [Pseudomonadales bacterium]RZV56638.1 MAG: peptidase M14 [Pseudomonadales bacterium]